MMTDCFCDYEPATLYRAKRVKARIDHRCNECARKIKLGETYERVDALWDGEFGSYKTCCRCLSLRDFVEAHVPCFCWAHGNMREDAKQEVEAWAPETVGLWFGAMRREVLIRRGER